MLSGSVPRPDTIEEATVAFSDNDDLGSVIDMMTKSPSLHPRQFLLPHFINKLLIVSTAYALYLIRVSTYLTLLVPTSNHTG